MSVDLREVRCVVPGSHVQRVLQKRIEVLVQAFSHCEDVARLGRAHKRRLAPNGPSINVDALHFYQYFN